MKILLILIYFPLFSFCQYTKDVKLPYKAIIISDSGIVKGYFFSYSDSAVIISTTKTYSPNSSMIIAASTINKLKVKHKTGSTILGAFAASIIGFTVTAGLTKNSGDVNNDGKTSFWELLYTAIEGTTSSNKHRRNTAFIVGAAGGATAMVIGLIANKNLSLTFPVNGRCKFFMENKHKVNEFVDF